MEVVILMGLQASGKSTFARQRFGPTHIYISKDLMGAARHKEQRQRRLVAEALAAGRSVIVDNTNPSPAEREPLIQIGRTYGARIVGYYFLPDVAASRRRNATRTGRERVPVVAIHSTAKRLTPPTYAEGFDALFTVHLTLSGNFETAPLPPPPSSGDL
jgi:predicted kinase